jgi:hypothetical protein
MPWYPLPVLLVIVAWLAVFASTGSVEVRGARIDLRLAGATLTALGALVFLLRARVQREWPFERKEIGK